MNIKEIRIEDFDYTLPDERIAKYPLTERDHSNLLHWNDGEIKQLHFYDIPDLLSNNDLLIYNNTKVIQARLHFQKETGATIEIFCLEPHTPADYSLVFQENKSCIWKCLVGNSKKWKEGKLTRTIQIDGETVNFSAERVTTGSPQQIRFLWDNPTFTFAKLLDAVGELPIPPYLNRDAEESDKTTYQTVYSKIEGSVAAPTAGLHFTPEVFSSLAESGVETAEVTLHVGAGTFRPVKSETIGGHDMHTELISVPLEIIEKIAETDRTIIAVGTTSVRTLESLSALGYRVMTEGEPHTERVIGQFELYDIPQEIEGVELLKALAEYMESNGMTTLKAATRIMIVPSFKFRVVNQIVTNFHQPKSTLLLLISAFIGDDWHNVYRYAMDNDFRFLSYGDSSLLFPTR